MYTITRIKRKYAQYIGVMPNKKSYEKRGKTWTYTTHTKNFLSVNTQISCLYNIHQKDTSTRYEQNKYTNMYIATCKRSCLNSKILSECFLERIV